MPMTEAEALALLRKAAKPYPRAAKQVNWRVRRFMRVWEDHAQIAQRLGFCTQPGCEARTVSRFCPKHRMPLLLPGPVESDL